MLAPQAANDSRNCILEIRAAVGGNESCLFAAALLRMYFNYITARGWRLEHISHSDGEVGGYKESLSRICGDGSYGRLKFESGAHRVQTRSANGIARTSPYFGGHHRGFARNPA